ncbi:MAG: FecCD family ABC transporter permease [Nitrospiria bacterium]
MSPAAQELSRKISSRPKGGGALLPLTILLIGTVFFATATGAVDLSLAVVARIVLNAFPFLEWGGWEAAQETIILSIRLPRVLLAVLIGGGLAVAGAALQALFRNPMADPGIIGISSGGALASVVAIASGLSSHHPLALPSAAFAGALLSLFLVYSIGVRQKTPSSETLLLSGIAVGIFMGAILSLILTRLDSNDALRETFFWLMGGLDGRGWPHLQAALWPIGIGSLGLLFFSRDLNILLLEGEGGAQTLGIELRYTRKMLLGLCALIIGAAVAFSGTIAFVGLIVPHMIRRWIGPNHRTLLPATFLSGGILLVGADLLARTLIAPEELRLGTITSLIGVPFFLHLLMQNRNKRT